MIRVRQVELSDSDKREITKQIRILEGKVAQNHWAKLVLRSVVTLLAVAILFAISRSPLGTLVVLVAGTLWSTTPLRLIKAQKRQRDSLDYQRSRLNTAFKTEISVENCEYIDFGEVKDEGVLYLFFDHRGAWLMLDGQNYYPTDSFPGTTFRLSYDSKGVLLNIDSDKPRLRPKRQYDPAIKIARELNFGTMDHAIVQADNEEDAMFKLKRLASGKLI